MFLVEAVKEAQTESWGAVAQRVREKPPFASVTWWKGKRSCKQLATQTETDSSVDGGYL